MKKYFIKKFIIFFFLISFYSISQIKTVITGQLFGYDNKPMLKANVHFKFREDSADVKTYSVGLDGKFKIELNDKRCYFISFTGANHSKLIIPFVNDRDQNINLQVNLKPLSYDNKIYVVTLIGDFNSFNFSGGKKMDYDSINNKFSITIDWDKPKFKYQLLNVVPERSVNGTQSEDFEYDGDGDYRSVVFSKDGKVDITFEPVKLITAKTEEKVFYKEKNFINAKIYSFLIEELKWYKEYSNQFNEYIKFGMSLKNFQFNWTKFIKLIKKELKQNKDKTYRTVLLQSYVSLNQFNVNDLDTSLAIELLKTTSPSSYLWDIKPVSVIAVTKFLEKNISDFYLEKFLAENKNRFIQLEILYTNFIKHRIMQEEEKANEIYDLITSNYIDLPFAQFIKENYAKEKIKVGDAVPDFSVSSIDDSTFIISNTRMLGKIYLIDFWATWCAPCVEIMKNLHSIYEKYKEKGFEIVSLSFDVKSEDVQKFRTEKWKMPWHNAFIKDQFKSDIANSFGIKSIPKPILVDKKGYIIAVGDELREENLEKKLREVIK